MELKKQPVTELEYWEIIEGLGWFIWRMNHDLADGHIEDPDGSIDHELAEAGVIQEKLVSEIGDKFNVIHSKDCPKTNFGENPPVAPEGKIYYWDWYKKMKEIFYKAEYDKIICSACPFSEGSEKMMALDSIPCSVFNGMAYRLSAPHRCIMVSCNNWSEDQLRYEIKSKFGGKTLKTFIAKESELKPKSKSH